MVNQEEVDEQRKLLALHRRVLTHYLRQQAILGTAYVPPSVMHGIKESRTEIERIKQIIRSWGFEVEDNPDDSSEEMEPSRGANSAPEEEERGSLREVLRAYQRRLRILEIQRANKGQNTPPEIITEIEDIQAEIVRIALQFKQLSPTVDRIAQRQRRSDALAAFYSKKWELAEELLEQVIRVNPDDQDAKNKLQQTQRQLDLRAAYQALRKLRDDRLWQATLDALDDFAREYPDAPDPDGLRAWAEFRRHRSDCYSMVVQSLQEVLDNDPSDDVARSMLTQARAIHEEGQ